MSELASKVPKLNRLFKFQFEKAQDCYVLLFPEGMLNGMTMTILIIYFPGLAYTFHDKFYIDGK